MSPIVYRQILIWFFLVFATSGLATAANAHPTDYQDSLMQKVANAKSDTEKVDLLLKLALFYRPGDVAKQFPFANEALSLSVKSRWPRGEMRAEELIGECYIKVFAYNDAVRHFKLSISASTKIKDEYQERVCLQYMIHCYHMQDSFKQAAAYQKLLLDKTAKAGDSLGVCNQMDAYAQRLSDLGRYREAISWSQRDVGIAKRNFSGERQSDLLASLLNSQAILFAKVREIDSALACLRTATSLAKDAKDSSLGMYIISTFCDVYTAARNYDSAIFYGRQTIKLGSYMNNLALQHQYAQMLSGLYRDNHQPAAALLYYVKSDSLSDIISNQRRIVDQAMQVSKISMEQQAEMNKLEKKSLEATRKTNRAQLMAALVAVLTLIVLTLIIYRSLRQKQKSNQVISQLAENLQSQNEVIDGALKAKELMLQETHHRIKNNLQLVSSLLELQVANMNDANAADALRTAQRRIQSIATVHSKLYGSSEDDLIEFSGFVNDLFARLSNAFGDNDARLEFANRIPTTLLPLNVVILLGLILNELITNTFKYACDGIKDASIGISLLTNDENHTLQYWDNGPGLPPSVFNEASGTLGLYLVKRMSKQLKGTTQYNYDGQSRFTVSFRTGS